MKRQDVWKVCKSKDSGQIWSPCYLNDNHTRIKVMEIKSFKPGTFYRDTFHKIQYMCLFDGVDETDFIFWDDQENQFTIVSLPVFQTQTFDLCTLQDWDF